MRISIDFFINIKGVLKNDMIDMYKTGKYNMSKIYEDLIERNAGKFVIELILSNYSSTKEILEQFTLQYDSKVEGLIYKMDEYIRENR